MSAGEVLVHDPNAVDPQTPWFFGSLTPVGNAFYDDWWVVIFDRQGRMVWALESPAGWATMHPRLGTDGQSLLLDRNGFWGQLSGGEEGYVERMDITGAVLETIDLPWLRHAYTEMPDGSFVWGAITDGTSEVLTHRAPDGTITALWNCRQYLARFDIAGGCASNTVNWSEATQTWLFSIFTNDTVVELDRHGEALRHFGPQKGAYPFDPPTSAFWYQHNPHWTDAGTLLVSTETEEDAKETVVREYVVSDGALTEVWNFGVGEAIWANNMGEAHRLPNGNTIHNYGETARIREADPKGEVVWDVSFGANRVIGRTTPIEDLYDFMQ